MKILGALALSALVSGAIWAADYSKSSNKELINLAGKVNASDIVSYNAEIEKRIEEMTVKDAREFREQIRASETKTYDAMKVKDFKAYRKSIDDAMHANRPKHPRGFAHKGDKRGEFRGEFKGGHCGEFKGGHCGMTPPPPPNAPEAK